MTIAQGLLGLFVLWLSFEISAEIFINNDALAYLVAMAILTSWTAILYYFYHYVRSWSLRWAKIAAFRE